jgi:hypothetical protein
MFRPCRFGTFFFYLKHGILYLKGRKMYLRDGILYLKGRKMYLRDGILYL